MDSEQIARWRLILGKAVEPELEESAEYTLSQGQQEMDSALGAVYDNQPQGGADQKKSNNAGGLKKSAPSLAKWLGSIRECFDADTVAIVQKDAIERKGLKELLYEPEILKNVEPDIHLITTLLSLKEQVPEESKNEVRALIARFVDQLKESLQSKIEEQIRGQLNRQKASPIPRYDSIN